MTSSSMFSAGSIRDPRTKVRGMNENCSRPCPHCGKTISSNKELCYLGSIQYGTEENFKAVMAAEAAASQPTESPVIANPELVAEPTKRKRTSRAKKVTDAT